MIGHQHFKIYKPFGMLSQLTSGEERQLRKKKFLSELYQFPEGVMPIGRLDEKSEGLLLMTTNGKLTDYINNAGVEKEYLAQLDGVINDAAIQRLQKGVSIGLFGKKYKTKPCKVRIQKPPIGLPAPHSKLRIGVHRANSWVSIILTEGKFRQVRKMTAAVGFPTIRLVRIRIGDQSIDTMKEGEVIQLNRLVI
ncbi:pseudouridine synthase [Maribacter thermophilus]|uniref:pseudouridine synthase n=1 Tax=Maribacter thermophilus TaxID=1197874 RepID=UPI0006418783|nr:pseudouridine synthase [Maribacter thermophilus]